MLWLSLIAWIEILIIEKLHVIGLLIFNCVILILDFQLHDFYSYFILHESSMAAVNGFLGTRKWDIYATLKKKKKRVGYQMMDEGFG